MIQWALLRPLLLPTQPIVKWSRTIETSYNKNSSTIPPVDAGDHWSRAWQNPHPVATNSLSFFFQPADSSPIPTLTDYHISLFSQFWIKVSHVKMCLDLLRHYQIHWWRQCESSCFKVMCSCTLWTFNCSIPENMLQCNIPNLWKISTITPLYKKGIYWPIAVPPTVSCIFELLLIIQLCQISPHITAEQFGFLKGSSTSDASVSLASAIITAIKHRAEVQLVAQRNFRSHAVG